MCPVESKITHFSASAQAFKSFYEFSPELGSFILGSFLVNFLRFLIGEWHNGDNLLISRDICQHSANITGRIENVIGENDANDQHVFDIKSILFFPSLSVAVCGTVEFGQA